VLVYLELDTTALVTSRSIFARQTQCLAMIATFEGTVPDLLGSVRSSTTCTPYYFRTADSDRTRNTILWYDICVQ